MTVWQWILLVVGAIVVGGGLAMTGGLYALSRRQPPTTDIELGVENGRLTPCPESPNCVSTQAPTDDETHYVEPVSYSGGRDAARDRVLTWLRDRRDAELVEEEPDYLRAVFSSRVFNFKDDVEVYLPEDESVAHFRSASRVGQGDMGVNRSRYQAFRQALTGGE